jgi:lipopolysaccharide transport system ATP-binding protein
MSEAIITIEHLSKSYLVGHQSARRDNYNSLREVIGREARIFGRKIVDLARGQQIVQGDDVEEFWALKDVSFEVRRGEIVGVVGRNGAGKSTLLKILSRITEPTEGRIKLRGRVASLLEVGTGFHPELTGRENVFLNGAILGMTQREIRKKFDEIVAFAEVDRFLDTPVKRYSSGMYVRLAFAVAAHLDPEILLVDEVLAVGDAAFQKKCLGKIESVTANEGRTVIFISHNTEALLSLCNRGILLTGGEVTLEGSIKDVVEQYFSNRGLSTTAYFEPKPDRPSITGVAINEEALKVGDLVIDVKFQSPFALLPPVPGIVVSSNLGTPIFGSNPRIHKDRYPTGTSAKSGVVRFEAKAFPLVRGQYRISVWLGDWQRDYDHKEDLLSFEFRPGSTPTAKPKADTIGYLEWQADWKLL